MKFSLKKFMNENIEKKNNIKEKVFNEKLKYFSKITDGLGKGIEPGVLNQVTYLNLLDFNTNGSCEGHTDGPAYPFGYIHFSTKHQSNPDSVSNKVYSEVRAEAFRLEREKFPEFDGFPEKNTSEINEFFNKNIEEGLTKHPLYKEHELEKQQDEFDMVLEKKKVDDLIEEFFEKYSEYNGLIYQNPDVAYANIYFTNKVTYEKVDTDKSTLNSESMQQIKSRSDEVLKVFNDFLKNKYENS